MNKNKRIDIVVKAPIYYLVYYLLITGLISSGTFMINSVFYILLYQHELILSLILASMLLFITTLLFHYDDEYSPVPTSGAILTVPEKNAAKIISDFLKKEFKEPVFNLKFKNDLIQGLKHEKIHWKISKKFKIKALIQLKVEKYLEEDMPIITSEFWCNSHFPEVKLFNKYYPKFFVVECIQTIFDFIYDLINRRFLENFHMRIQDTFEGLRLK